MLNVEHDVSEGSTDHLSNNSEGKMLEITREEVVKAVKRLNNRLSPGEIEVVAKCSKQKEKLWLNGYLT